MSHPVLDDIRVRDSVRFVKRHALEGLEVPWPRSQDLPSSSSSRPEKDDFVVAVSHVWPYQAHPDPLGEKCLVLRELLEEACAVHRPRGKTLLFLDFLSTPQRPFARGQAPRTPAQDEAFAATLMAFPMIYFMADATIHVDVEMSPVPEDTHRYTVTTATLRGVQLQTVGPTVQVMDFGTTCSHVAPFDFIMSIGDRSVRRTEDVDHFRNASVQIEGSTPSLSSCFQSCSEQELHTVQMRRAPFGRRNVIPAHVKGWIFLERFVSMVKAAMVPESRVTSVAFSNSHSVLEDIFAGGARLRAAAAGGKAKLHETLKEFAKELDTKQFSSVSMDRPLTGGRGIQRSNSLAAVNASTYGASDRDVVWELMQVLVTHLAVHWEAEAAAQRQRQLVLAVCRGDVTDAVLLIQAGANPNGVDTTGRTCLHAAASFRQVHMVRELLRHRADTTMEDRLGNLPIHLLPLYSQDATVELFNMLAPSEMELAKANVAGVSPLKKFAAWVDIECREAPFAPAQRRLEELRALFPHVLQMPTPGAITRSTLSPMSVPAVRGCERRVVCERLVSIPVWEPLQEHTRVHVVFLALCGAVPWSITEAAAGLLAECICGRFGAKLWAITPEALDSAVLAAEAPLPRFVDDLEAVVGALPLGDRFFVIDNSCGLAVPLLWRIVDRLHGALVVNACSFFSEEFEGTHMHRTLGQVFTHQLALARSRDPERAASILAQWSTAPRFEDLLQRRAVFEAAWGAAPENHWLWCAYNNLDVARLSRLLWTLPPLPALPVTFAVGSLAPAPFTTEPVVRFQLLLPDSKVAYIPDSRLLWDFEGEGPACKVALLLYELMEERLRTRRL